MRTSTIRFSTTAPVSVNGAVIANADIAREVQNHHGGNPKSAWDAAARALVIRQLLLQRAHDLALTPAPISQDGLRETDEESLIRILLEQEVRTPTADEATCRRYYQSNQARFRAPDLYEPLHILFKADPADETAYADARAKAEATAAALAANPGRFEAMARAVSDCSSAAEGGRLGQVSTGDTTPEFETALNALSPGQISPPVETRYGIHIIRLDRKIAGQTLPFEQVRDRIAAYLHEASWRRAVSQYIALLAGQATITGCDLPAAASPLLQ